MGCQRSITGRFLGCMIAGMFVLTGCIGSAQEKDEPKTWTGVESCILLSVDNSFGGHQWVCSDGTDTYFFKARGIYRIGEEKNELIFETSDVVLCMAADGERIVYGTDDNKLWEYDFGKKSQSCINEAMRVWSVVLWDGNAFMGAVESTDGHYRWWQQTIYQYMNGAFIKLEDYETNRNNGSSDIKEADEYFSNGKKYWTYRGICISDNNLKYLSVTDDSYSNYYIRNGYLCGLMNALYYTENGKLPANFPEHVSGYILYSSQYTAMLNDKFCMIVQFYNPTYGDNNSDRFYHKNRENISGEALYYWDIETGDCNLIYETDKPDEWIVGYTDDLEYCLIMKTDGLYKVAVDGTEDDELVWNAEGCFNVAVETLDGVVYIFTDEDEVRLVGKVDIREEAADAENPSVSSDMCDDINR